MLACRHSLHLARHKTFFADAYQILVFARELLIEKRNEVIHDLIELRKKLLLG